jgi:hypothetical protein
MNYDPSITLAPPLPAYLRGFVVGECHISLNRPRIGIWMPDFALCGLCEPDKLIMLPEFSSVRTYAPLVYIANACPPVPFEAVSIAISLIYEVLKKYSRQDGVKLLLEDKGPWKTVQLLRVCFSHSFISRVGKHWPSVHFGPWAHLNGHSKAFVINNFYGKFFINIKFANMRNLN